MTKVFVLENMLALLDNVITKYTCTVLSKEYNIKAALVMVDTLIRK